jgi:hypothetical protein
MLVVIFFGYEKVPLCGKVEINPRTLWNSNERQTPSKSFNAIVCPSQRSNSEL